MSNCGYDAYKSSYCTLLIIITGDGGPLYIYAYAELQI